MKQLTRIACLAALYGGSALPAAPDGGATPTPEPPARHDVVVVTGSYQPVPMEESDRSVAAYELTDERRLTSQSVADFLQLEPSADLRQRAPNNVQGDLSIRGSTFGQTLVLIDGLRVNDAQTGHHNLNLPFGTSAVERIEILKGSGSALYGSDAVGGVVNFITRTPERTEVRLRTGLGNHGVNQQAGSISVAQKGWAEHLTFTRDFSTGFMENRDYRNLALSSRTHISTPLGPARVVLSHADRPFGAEQFYGNFNSWERTKTWFASMQQGLGERTTASFGFRRHTDLFVLFRDRPQVYTNRHATENCQFALRRWESLGRNARFHYGAEGLHETIASNNLGHHSRGRGAGYFALDVRALRRFSFTVGARHELHGSLNSQFSPTAAAGVWLSPRVKLRASASRAFRVPTFTDLYYRDPATLGSPDLEPETAWSYEAGLDWNAGGKVRGEFAVFRRLHRNGIDYIRAGDDPRWRAANHQRLRFDGVEAGVTVMAARDHRLGLHYAHLHGARDAAQGIVSRYVFQYARHSGVASWEARLPGDLIARSRLGAVQRYRRGEYAVWDLHMARDFGRFHPFVQLTNLTDTSYEQIPGVLMPARAIVGGVEFVVYTSGK